GYEYILAKALWDLLPKEHCGMTSGSSNVVSTETGRTRQTNASATAALDDGRGANSLAGSEEFRRLQLQVEEMERKLDRDLDELKQFGLHDRSATASRTRKN
ncbi:hypothetical protein BOX15_Mlig013762g1, partial [Macrostomum lignano]